MPDFHLVINSVSIEQATPAPPTPVPLRNIGTLNLANSVAKTTNVRLTLANNNLLVFNGGFNVFSARFAGFLKYAALYNNTITQ